MFFISYVLHLYISSNVVYESLLSGFIFKITPVFSGNRAALPVFNSPGGYTKMLAFDENCHIIGFKCALKFIRYLQCQTFLYLWTTGVIINHPVYLGKADNASPAFVCNMGFSKKRKKVMLTK